MFYLFFGSKPGSYDSMHGFKALLKSDNWQRVANFIEEHNLPIFTAKAIYLELVYIAIPSSLSCLSIEDHKCHVYAILHIQEPFGKAWLSA